MSSWKYFSEEEKKDCRWWTKNTIEIYHGKWPERHPNLPNRNPRNYLYTNKLNLYSAFLYKGFLCFWEEENSRKAKPLWNQNNIYYAFKELVATKYFLPNIFPTDRYIPLGNLETNPEGGKFNLVWRFDCQILSNIELSQKLHSASLLNDWVEEKIRGIDVEEEFKKILQPLHYKSQLFGGDSE